MKDWKHLTFEQRKTNSSGISHGYKLRIIGENLLVDPTSVSKEVKRNRIEISVGLKNNCKRTQRWPYVCTGCKKRYNNCPFTKYKYDAAKAQEKADTNLVNSRRGIDVDNEEFKQLDKIIKDGIDSNKSIYQIKVENNDTIKKCISTLYGYINKSYLTTKIMQLLIKKENIIKSMNILKIIKLTEQVILILIILPFYISIQESMSGNLIFLEL